MYYIYILYSKLLGKIYTGKTRDLRKRLDSHNNGKNYWTKRGIPWILIYYEVYLNRTDASKRELFLKSGRGKEVIKQQLEKTLSKLVPPNRRI